MYRKGHTECLWGEAHLTCRTLQWRHNERDGVSNRQPHDCLPKRLFRRRSKKTSKLPATGLCEGNSPVTSEFPTQRANNADNFTIWWRHHDMARIPSWPAALLGCSWFMFFWKYFWLATLKEMRQWYSSFQCFCDKHALQLPRPDYHPYIQKWWNNTY